MHTCMMHTFKNISREPIGYNTKSALMGLKGFITHLDSTRNKL